MDDVAVLEAAQHIEDRVRLADMGEELVAEPFALAGPAHEAGDVDEFELRRDDDRAAGDLRQPAQPRIRHRDAGRHWGSMVQNG